MKPPVKKGGKKVLQGSLGGHGEKRIQRYMENELPQRHAAFLMKPGDQHIFLRLGGGPSALPAPDGSGQAAAEGVWRKEDFPSLSPGQIPSAHRAAWGLAS